jgi:hypothetical protein
LHKIPAIVHWSVTILGYPPKGSKNTEEALTGKSLHDAAILVTGLAGFGGLIYYTGQALLEYLGILQRRIG